MKEFRQPGNIKVPLWLTPVKHYVGPAWYQKEVEVPENRGGKKVELFLERAHFITRLWIDGQEVGKQNSLVAPHIYDITDDIAPGRHTLTIKVDDTIHEEVNVGLNSHSMANIALAAKSFNTAGEQQVEAEARKVKLAAGDTTTVEFPSAGAAHRYLLYEQEVWAYI